MTDVSPFARAHAQLSPLGFTLLPALPHNLNRPGAGKAPGHFSGGGWSGLPKWSQYAQTGVSSFLQGMWEKLEGANAGFLTGTSAGRDAEGNPLQLVVLDFDCESHDDLQILLASAPSSPAEKVGRVGLSRLFRAPVDMKSKSYDSAKGGGRLLDVLCAGRFCVSPPSIHPTSGLEYRWTQGPVAVSELPVLTSQAMEQLEEALQVVGWEPQAESVRVSAGPRVERVRGDYNNVWAETNGEAIARLSEWFPLLNLPGTRQSRAGIFSAVPVWRPSGSGRPTEIRKANLSASSGLGATPAGIRDWAATGPDANLTAIDLVQRALDLDAPDAMNWLRETLGLDNGDAGAVIDLVPRVISDDDLLEPLRPKPKTAPASADTDTEAALGAGGATETVSDIPPDATHGPGEFPPHLLEVPGLVGDLMDWMARTAVRPLPIVNLGAVLCLVGTLAARKWATPTEGGTHLYILGLAGTGQGKDHPRRAATHILAAAGLKRFVAPSSWKSDSALVQHVSRNPACVSFSDEVGEFIGRLNSKGATTHERGVSGVMRELWGINWGIHTPPGWADSRDRQRIEPISAPAYSFLGLSVPEAVWEALAGADLSNGFANRFLVLANDREVPEQDPEESVFDVPEALLQRLRDLAEHGGLLANITMHNGETSAPMVRVPWEGGRGGPAHQVFKDFQEFCRVQPESETLMKRTAEIACRLATIRAIGIAGEHAVVTVADIEWGRDVALWSARRMIADTAAFMSESDHQARTKFVLRHLSEAPGRFLSRTALCRKVNHRFDGRALDLVIEGLLDAGQVGLKESERKGAGRKATGYFAL
jgi:hypothetical protein